MTREKAYEIIDRCPICTECDGSFPYNCDECGEAFLTAFDALKQPEIVRCKDCIHWNEGHTEECHNSDSVCFHNGWCKPDWFCADGERKAVIC